MLILLENKALLAAGLALEIAQSTQEYSLRQPNSDEGKKNALMIGSIATSVFGLG